MAEHEVKPEIEIYDAGMINNAKVFEELGVLKRPLHFQFVMGVLGGLQPTLENLAFLKSSLPAGSTWSLCAVGLAIFGLGATAIAAGGNVRVGLEDSIYVAKGQLAENNAQLVAKMKRISQEIGREIATPDEARKILNLI